MARSPFSIRNPEAVLGAETYQLGWEAVRPILSIWIPVQLIAAFIEFGRQISGVALLFLILVLWLYAIPKVIRSRKPSRASTAGLTWGVFGRHILPGVWVGISASVPTVAVAGLATNLFAQDSASTFNWYIPALAALIWYAAGSLLHLAIFGLSGGWRVSLLNLGGGIAGMLAGLLSFALSGSTKLDFAARFGLAVFVASQLAILPMGIAVTGWAIRATLGRAQARAAGLAVAPVAGANILKVEVPAPPPQTKAASANSGSTPVLKIQFPPPPAPALKPEVATTGKVEIAAPPPPTVDPPAPPPPVLRGAAEPSATKPAVRNFGTRQDTVEQADAYWLQRMTLPQKDPYVLYSFPEADSARNALLAIPCIAVDDAGKLACSEVLTFGYYLTKSGCWEAFFGGELSLALWKQAKAGMLKYGGKPINELAPEAQAETSTTPTAANPATVTFVEQHQRELNGQILTYMVYKAPDAASAKEFLAGQEVKERFKYLMVDTPEGRFGRDIDGMFKEPPIG
jgi:hypothetical protein